MIRQPTGTDTPLPASPGQVFDPSLDGKVAAKHTEILESDAAHLSVAQRLTRRALKDTITIPLTDDLGEFEIEVRIPLTSELDKILGSQAAISTSVTAGDQEATKAAQDQLFRALAEICVDPSLDYEFWKSGAFSVTDMGQILKEVAQEVNARAESTKSFRKKPKGSRTF